MSIHQRLTVIDIDSDKIFVARLTAATNQGIRRKLDGKSLNKFRAFNDCSKEQRKQLQIAYEAGFNSVA